MNAFVRLPCILSGQILQRLNFANMNGFLHQAVELLRSSCPKSLSGAVHNPFTRLQDHSEFLRQQALSVFLIAAILVTVLIHYILDAAPHCCEDINYLAFHSFEQRKAQFWFRTVNEGRWFFALTTAVASGYVVTYLFALTAVLASAGLGILISLILGARERRWRIPALFLALNPFFLVLYPWPISFALFNLANLTVAASFYLFLRKPVFIFLTPWLVAICLATYQPTLAFLLEIVFLHYISQVFLGEGGYQKEKLSYYFCFLLAAALGYGVYLSISKLLLFAHDVAGPIQRYHLWGHTDPADLADYSHAALQGFKWFLHLGIREGINPASSAWVGDLSLRDPFITCYKFSLLFLDMVLLVCAIRRKSVPQVVAAVAVIPVSVLITLLPLIASGAGIINRVFYPMGLVLPTLIYIHLNQPEKSSIKGIMAPAIAILLLLHVAYTAQFSKGIAEHASLAKSTHREILMRLYAFPHYTSQHQVVFFAHEGPTRATTGKAASKIIGNYWPLYNETPSFSQFIKLYQGYDVRLVSRAELSDEEIGRIESHIVSDHISPWPHASSVFQLPTVRDGIFIVYLQLPLSRP